jgi:Carboxypeptidase regulatory-like domain/TonB dependent receptor
MQRLCRRQSIPKVHSNPPFVEGGVGQRKHQKALIASALFFCCWVIFAAFPCAHAQQMTAAVTGTVVDPSGAPVVGAKVTAKDLDRGILLTTETNETGVFNFPSVPVGNYEVKAEAKGFQAAKQPALTLVLNQTARLNFQLRVGQVTETVEVTAAAPILQTDTSLIGSVLEARTIENLPLSTHNTNQLTLIAHAGVITPNLFGFQAAQNSFGTGRPYVNGAREQENNFLLDGMDNNQPDNNDVGFVPAPDAVQEFNLITGSAPADFGNYLGGVVNVTVKSGTNDFHGSLYDYLRRGGLNANSWQNNTACAQNADHVTFSCGRDQAGNQVAPRPALHYDNFGFTFGGPIIRNKLFFFSDYAESLFSQPAAVRQVNLISDAERIGNFAELCTEGFSGGICNNAAHQLFDPASSATPGGRTAFANNQIPLGRLNSAARAIVTSPFYPGGSIANNLNQFKTNSYQGDLKIDFIPSEKDHLMGRWSQQFITAPSSNSLELLGNSDRTFPLKNLVLSETHTFSSSLLNDARLGFQYFPVTEGFSNPTGQNLGAAFGIAGVTVDFLPAMVFNAGGTQPGTFGNADLVQSFHDTTWQFEDTATWTHGRHIFHGGFQGYHYIMNDLYPGNAGLAGQFIFNGQFTGNTSTSNGAPAADFMLGLPQDVQQGNGGGGNKYLRNSLFGIFGQDNWRIKDNLTLNLGLRWELITARGTSNGQDVNFDLTTGQPKIGFGYNTYNGIGNFQPRIGFAWEPRWTSIWAKNTVIRGAYGISSFMEANGVNNLPYQNPPFVQAHEVINPATQALPSSTLSQGFGGFPASACTVASLQAFSPACLRGVTLHLTNPNLQPAIDQQWNLTIQRQLGSKTSLSIAYVGNKIDHMSDIFIFNQLRLVSTGVTAPGPFAQSLLNCNAAGTTNLCGGPRPTVRFNDSSGIQRYNALQITVAQRAWQGLTFQTNYTWSKCLTNSLGYFGPFGDEEQLPGAVSQTGFGFFFQDAYNAKGDYGRCISDAASLFNGYMTYELPFGKGRRFGSGAEGIANTIIGGWSIASNFTFHSGFALYPHGPDNSGTGSASPRPNCVAGVSQSGSGQLVGPGTSGVIGTQFLNPAAVTAPAPGTFGTCAAGSFRGPGLATSDLSIVKAFTLSERTNFQFITQFINLTNTPIFGAPNASQGSTFGLITSSNPGRQVQFGMKLLF